MVVILWEFKSPRPHQEPPSHVLGPWRLYYKRLERGRFRLFQIPMGASSVAMDATELAVLLDGIDVGKVRRPARWTPPTPNWRRSIGRSLARRAEEREDAADGPRGPKEAAARPGGHAGTPAQERRATEIIPCWQRDRGASICIRQEKLASALQRAFRSFFAGRARPNRECSPGRAFSLKGIPVSSRSAVERQQLAESTHETGPS